MWCPAARTASTPNHVLIFVFVVAMVTRPGAKVGQLHAVVGRLNVFLLADIATVILVEQLEYNLDDLVLLRLRNCGGALVEETVGLADVVGRPLAGAIVVV